jgi:hypothetical protein
MLFAVLFIVVCLVEDTNEVSRSLQKQVVYGLKLLLAALKQSHVVSSVSPSVYLILVEVLSSKPFRYIDTT